jgi:hypothetical protein
LSLWPCAEACGYGETEAPAVVAALSVPRRRRNGPLKICPPQAAPLSLSLTSSWPAIFVVLPSLPQPALASLPCGIAPPHRAMSRPHGGHKKTCAQRYHQVAHRALVLALTARYTCAPARRRQIPAPAQLDSFPRYATVLMRSSNNPHYGTRMCGCFCA